MGAARREHLERSQVGKQAALELGHGAGATLRVHPGHLEAPLPASTQWDIVAAVATALTPAFAELTPQAAQGACCTTLTPRSRPWS
jgi:hypothetical protein